MVLEMTLESPLHSKEFQTHNPKGNQSWIFTGRTDTEAETPILWPPDAKNWLIGKDPDAGKDWREEKGTTEDEMVGWHHRLDGHEFEQASGAGWWTGRPGMLQSMGSQRVKTPLSDWTELNHRIITTCLHTLIQIAQLLPAMFPMYKASPFTLVVVTIFPLLPLCWYTGQDTVV